MTWGPQVKYLLEIAEMTGELPLALQNRPRLEPRLQFYTTIFNELADSRQWSQSGIPLALPISEYVAYFALFYIESLEEREILFNAVRTLDRTFVRVVGNKVLEAQKADAKPDRSVDD